MNEDVLNAKQRELLERLATVWPFGKTQEIVEMIDGLEARVLRLMDEVADMAEQDKAALDGMRKERDALREELNEDRAVCICGCAAEDHESLGEDGEQCEHEDHQCLRVCAGAADIVRDLRRERDVWENKADSLMEEAARHIAEAKAQRAAGYHECADVVDSVNGVFTETEMNDLRDRYPRPEPSKEDPRCK